MPPPAELISALAQTDELFLQAALKMAEPFAKLVTTVTIFRTELVTLTYVLAATELLLQDLLVLATAAANACPAILAITCLVDHVTAILALAITAQLLAARVVPATEDTFAQLVMTTTICQVVDVTPTAATASTVARFRNVLPTAATLVVAVILDIT